MKRIQVYLPEPLLKRIEALARETGLSKAEIIRRALDERLK